MKTNRMLFDPSPEPLTDASRDDRDKWPRFLHEMRNGPIRGLKPRPAHEEIRPDEEAPPVSESVQHTKPKNPHRTFWIFVTILLAGLLTVSWYSHPPWVAGDSLAGAMNNVMPGMQGALDDMARRLDSAEERVLSWTDRWNGVTEHMKRLEATTAAGFKAARKQASDAAAAMGQQIQAGIAAQVDKRFEPMAKRLAGLEAAQQAEHALNSRLQADLAALRREMAEQIATARKESTRDAGTPDAGNPVRLQDRQRVDFDVAKDKTKELAPGIMMTIEKIDIGRQRVDGRLQLLPDSRTLLVRDQPINQPMVFYTKRDSLPRELVFKKVTRRDVAGYLMVPRPS